MTYKESPTDKYTENQTKYSRNVATKTFLNRKPLSNLNGYKSRYLTFTVYLIRLLKIVSICFHKHYSSIFQSIQSFYSFNRPSYQSNFLVIQPSNLVHSFKRPSTHDYVVLYQRIVFSVCIQHYLNIPFLFILPLIHLSIYSFIHSSHHPAIQSSYHLTIYLSIHPIIHLSNIQLSNHPTIHSSIHRGYNPLNS